MTDERIKHQGANCWSPSREGAASNGK